MTGRKSATAIQRLSGITQGLVLSGRVMRSRFKTRLARQSGKKIVFIIGTPTHNNIGDLAIALAQANFIGSIDQKITPISLTFEEVMLAKQNILAELIRPGDILMGHGGGNMGDMYLREELCRRKFIQAYPNNKVIIFPQTIHFSESEIGKKELKQTQEIYAAHKDLTVIPREKHSYEIMKRVFKANNVLFTPDIVLSLNFSLSKRQRNGLLICLRNDQEAKIDESEKNIIEDVSKKYFRDIRYTDTVSHLPLFNYRSKKRIVENKLDEFRSAKLVITDRLHGMVFAAITGTPCIALASFNHKVTNTFKWLEHLPYIKFCTDIATLDKLIQQIDIDKSYEYDPTYFDKYWNKLRSAITGGE